jgi:hypothetical protein
VIAPLRSPRDALLALRDHAWTAWDVARAAGRRRSPALVDLLAGGRRGGFCESPDSLYAVGFLPLGPGAVYLLRIPSGPAFYLAVSLHSSRCQRHFELAGEAASRERGVTLRDGEVGENGLDTRGFRGLTQVMVRQYFDRTAGHRPPEMPRVEQLQPPAGEPARRLAAPAPWIAGLRFLAWRLKAVAAFKLIMLRYASRLPKNRFLTMEDLEPLRHGARQTVPRMGMTSFAYAFCAFELAPGESLAIRYRPADSGYFAFSLNNSWFQGIDRGRGAAYLSSLQLAPDGEGRFTLEVGDAPAGGPLLDVRGYRRGVVHFRRISPAPGDELPECKLQTRARPERRRRAANDLGQPLQKGANR